MKTLNKYYVEYEEESGKILKVSKSEIVSDNPVIKTSSFFIDDVYNDIISPSLLFINNGAVYKKDGTIFLPEANQSYDIIPIVESGMSDVNLKLYKDNKLLDIAINPLSLKTWYDRRMGNKFSFAGNSEPFYFIIKRDGEVLKKLEIPVNEFLETFQTTVDLSDIDDLTGVEISTRQVLERYQLQILSNKYEDSEWMSKFYITNKTDSKTDMVITCDRENGLIKINHKVKSINKKLLKDLMIYLVDQDPNYIQYKIVVPLSDLVFSKSIEIKQDLSEPFTDVYCNLDNIFVSSKII